MIRGTYGSSTAPTAARRRTEDDAEHDQAHREVIATHDEAHDADRVHDQHIHEAVG